MCDLSGSPASDGRCDICVALWNCIVAGPVVSDSIPPMMAQDLHKSLNQGDTAHERVDITFRRPS